MSRNSGLTVDELQAPQCSIPTNKCWIVHKMEEKNGEGKQIEIHL